jgi:hypothetical protein|tara:strand:- start:711 stop:1112 length:402 start_codon:yes stop_codon:yes gene_type:complete
MAQWDVGVWDESVWDVDPPNFAAGGGAKRRRPNEKIIWYDDWVKSQKENNTPKEEKIEAVEEAIKVVKAYKEKTIPVVDAKAAILKAKNAEAMLLQVQGLKDLMETYFKIKNEKERVQRQDNEFVILAMLGVL